MTKTYVIGSSWGCEHGDEIVEAKDIDAALDLAEEAVPKYCEPVEGEASFPAAIAYEAAPGTTLGDDPEEARERALKADMEFGSRTVVLCAPEPACYAAEGDVGDHATKYDQHDYIDGDPRGHGGGVVYTDVCRRCGMRKTVDTWAQDPATGEQGFHTVIYKDGEIPEGE